MKKAVLKLSTREDKKYQITYDNKTIHFGSQGSSDYTKHKNIDRKKRYISRHQPREDWSDPKTAGFWSRWLLWNQKTLNSSIKDIKNRFNINVRRE